MVAVFSYIIAVLLTVILAIILYPIAAIFWLLKIIGKVLVFIFDLFGKVSDAMFKFTTKSIRRLWKDIKNTEYRVNYDEPNEKQWICICGKKNAGKFCSDCGAAMPLEELKENEINTAEFSK